RVCLRLQDLGGSARANDALDADRRRLAEADVEAEVVGEGCLDYFLLDLAVERDRDLLAGVVLADVDQWVLLGELRERDAEGTAVVLVAGDDHRFQGWWRDVVPAGVLGRC